MSEQRKKTLEELYKEAFGNKIYKYNEDCYYDDEFEDDDADCICD